MGLDHLKLTRILERVTKRVATEQMLSGGDNEAARDRLVQLLLLNGVRPVSSDYASTLPDGYFLSGSASWIPVDTDKPLIGDYVLTFCEEDGINMGLYVGYDGFVVHLWNSTERPHKVTHWMPLPIQPKEDN